MFNGTLKFGFFIDISWRYLKTFIALIDRHQFVVINSDNLLIFKFRNSKSYLKDNFANN